MLLRMDEETYTVDSIPELKKKLREEQRLAREYNKRYPDEFTNPHEKTSRSLKKLISLLQHGLHISDYSFGQVLVNERFVVSLASNKWRVRGKQGWYHHKHDLNHFVCNYILKEDFKSVPTPEQELDYFQAKLKELFSKKPKWLMQEIRKAVQDESPDL